MRIREVESGPQRHNLKVAANHILCRYYRTESGAGKNRLENDSSSAPRF